MPGRDWFSTYCLFAMTYSALRKPFVIHDHQIRSADYTYNKPHHRPLLKSEIASVSLLSGFMGLYMCPWYVYKDVKNLEISLHKSDKNLYVSDDEYLHTDTMDLLLL